MDYQRSVEAVIPGVQGRVLGVLSRTHAELSMRQVAGLAAVSQTQASQVLGRLIELGIVERRDVGRSALVRMDRTNAAGQLVERLADLRHLVLDKMRAAASGIHPTPVSLVVFGSFARGQSAVTSDVDVLSVRAAGIDADSDGWVKTLGAWADEAAHLAGNPVNLLDLAVADLTPFPSLDPRLWREILVDGIVLVGSAPGDLTEDG